MNQRYELTDDEKELCYYLEYYDLHGKFPWEKVRIDITISSESLDKIKDKNKSEIIDNLIKEEIIV